MARLETLLPMTRAGLPAAPDLVILNGLRRAAIELCRQSHVWQEQLDPQQVLAGQGTYDIEAPNGAWADSIVWCKYNDIALKRHVNERDMLELAETSGTPSAFSTSVSGQAIRLYPTPDKAASLTMYAVLVPGNDASSIPDHLLEEYRPGIVALAKADLMGNAPGMPWNNPREAAVQHRIGHDWIVRAKRKQTSGGWTQMRVAPRAFI